MAVEIRQTIVTPYAEKALVQLHISDAPLDAEGEAKLRIVLSAKVDLLPGMLLDQIQRDALSAARDAISPILQRMAKQIQESGR